MSTDPSGTAPTPSHLSPPAARRVLLILTVTRWFPVGLVVGLITLLPLERGLSVAQALTAMSFVGFVVFALELPTSGFADAFGRKPVYVVAAGFGVASATAYLMAQTFWAFALAAVVSGVFRALDSGPLEAWFVDTVHLTEPGADVDRSLSAQGTLLGGAIATGALISGGLVWWHPFHGSSALLLPFACWVVLSVAHLGAVLLLMHEPRPPQARSGARRALQSTKDAPRVVRDGLRTLRASTVLRGLVVAELFWALAMVVYETFQPIRLAELLGSEVRAGALMGPIAAAGWAVFALGSALAGMASSRLGVSRTAILARVLNGLGALVMGLVAGPAALVAAYLFTYATHGSAGPMHAALLHREARAENRATVLSMNSMVAFLAFSLSAPLLGLLADRTSNQVAMMTAGAVSLAGAVFYLPALRRERERAATGARAG